MRDAGRVFIGSLSGVTAMREPPSRARRSVPETGAAEPMAAADLAPLVYERLRELARGFMRREGGYHTLQPTAVVHEAYIRMARLDRIEWRGKTHFLAVAATQMRRVLVEHARAAASQKRGSRSRRITLEDSMVLSQERVLDVLAIDEALRHLEQKSPRQSRVAELRLFGGLLVDETALVLGVSSKTVKRDWSVARAWLARELRSGRPEVS